MKHKLESRLPGEISVTSEPPPRVIEIKTKVNKWDLIKLKSILMKVKEDSEKFA